MEGEYGKSWWASDGGECARKCFDRCTSHFSPICIQDIDANKNTNTYTQGQTQRTGTNTGANVSARESCQAS